jgi:hypothetical protein
METTALRSPGELRACSANALTQLAVAASRQAVPQPLPDRLGPIRRHGPADIVRADQAGDLRQITDHDRHTRRQIFEQLVGQSEPVVLAGVLQQRDADVGINRMREQIRQRDGGEKVHAVTDAGGLGLFAQPRLEPRERRRAEEHEVRIWDSHQRGDQLLAAAIRSGCALMEHDRRIADVPPRP